MADAKISALPASTTPLAGTEVLPIVQSSTTRQVSVANLTAGRAISATEVTLSTGNLIIGTSGKGIDFSADSSAAGMTSELLDDYEEGTFTPTWQNLTLGNGTTSGTYIKIGRMVYVSVNLTWGSTTSASGSVSIDSTLPFVSGADFYFGSGNILDSGIANYIVRAQVSSNSANMSFAVGNATSTYLLSGGGPTATIPMNWTTNDTLTGSCWYMATA